MCFLTSSGCSFIASEILMKIMPFSESVFLKVVATETESTTTSIATPLNFFCSSKEIPSFLKVAKSSGSTSSKESYFGFPLGAEGPSVQMGSAIAWQISNWIKAPKFFKKMLLLFE